MSSTETQTATTEQAHPPAIKIFTRFASIPIISSSLGTINDALANNAYTRQPYAHAKGLSSTAYKLTEPLQVRLAPLIVPLDGIANKAVDVVEARYPYPFKAQPEDVASYVRERKDSTISGVNKAIKTPALSVAQTVDHTFTPIVDCFEYAVTRLNYSDAGPSSPLESKYQYQRALALSKTLKENLYGFSNEQLKHLQAQSVIVQKASETAHSITAVASSSLSTAQTKIHSLSENMLTELHKLQTSTSQLSTSLQSSVHESASQIQHAYADLTAALTSTVQELTRILRQDAPMQEKVSALAKEVQSRVNPLLETLKKGVSDVLARSKEADSSTDEANGHEESVK